MYLKEEDNIPENETEEEMYIRLKSKARKMMFNSKGVPFAPWLMRQIDEDVIIILISCHQMIFLSLSL